MVVTVEDSQHRTLDTLAAFPAFNGLYALTWNGSPYASGTYYIKVLLHKQIERVKRKKFLL
ncbi:MAG: hypothetical protein AAB445_02185 [Patescibacteria group bacterium]